MAILTIKHYNDIIDSFINNVKSSNKAYYVFVGKPDSWDDDAHPPTANGSVYSYEQTVYDDMIYGKKISNTDISYMVPRYNWVTNTVYDRYDQYDGDLYDKNFFVVTDNMSVYKCIFNNYGEPSTIKPYLTSSAGTFSTGDGYVWKYMYTIDSNSNSLFSSTSYIPVIENNNVQSNAVSGTLDYVVVENGNSNFQTYTNGYFTAVVNSTCVQLSNSASFFNNFYSNSSIYLKTGFGAGQIRKIGNYNGASKQLIVYEPFDIKENIELSNINNQQNIINGTEVKQNFTKIYYTYLKGYYQLGDVLTQTDTSNSNYSTGIIVSANSTYVEVFQTSQNNFAINYPIFNASYPGTLKTGTVTITAGNNYVVDSNVVSTTSFSTDYNVNDYIKIGQSNANIRRITGIYPSVTRTFNANTAVDNANDFIALSPQTYANNDRVTYIVSPGNTAISGLANNTQYYIVQANSTGVILASSSSGANIDITASSISETGHSLIRRAYVITDNAFNNSLVANTHYSIPYALNPTSITFSQANGIVSDTNLNSNKLSISNSVYTGINFIVGEIVTMVDVNNISQSVTGFATYANSSSIIIDNVDGLFVSGYYILGSSSNQKAYIDSVLLNPNITISNPIGTLVSGRSVSFINPTDNVTEVANATITSHYFIPNEQTEYIISPTVNINGDGNGAQGYSLVNSSINSISSIVMINNGIGYTKADISLEANSQYVSDVSFTPVISPLAGHGADVYQELGARYAGITVNFANSVNESYKYPGYGNYRKIGILENPLFNDVTLTLTNFDRAKMTVTNSSGYNFANGEIVYQPSTNASAVVVYYDSNVNGSFIELKNITGPYFLQNYYGPFISNNQYANSVSANDNIIGLTSGAIANVEIFNISYFTQGTNVGVLSEVYSGGTGKIANVISNTQISLTNVSGRFDINDIVYDPSTNAYANVVSIETANNKVDVSSIFGNKFNQTSRITLNQSYGIFKQFEYVNQLASNASGKIISTNNEIDLLFTGSNTFNIGDLVYSQNTGANGVVTFANSTYLKLTNFYGKMYNGDTINNGSVIAPVSNVYQVLLLSDVQGKFQTGTYTITGNSSTATGISNISNTITYPDLVRETGSVTYIEQIEPFTKSNNSQEKISLVIKF